MKVILAVLLVTGLTAADQYVKFRIAEAIPEGGGVPFIPGILELTYEKNTGAAFSLFEDFTWLLSILSLLAAMAIVFFLIRKHITHPMGVLSLLVILAGALGNLIDRVRLGYVVDLLKTQFIKFPIFNIADICVVTGGIVFCAYILIYYGRSKDGEEADEADTDGA